METISYPLNVDGWLTRVIEAGSGADPVLFLHGLGARADRWRGTVERVGSVGFRAIAFDMPGHGFAAKEPGGPTTVPELAGYLIGLLRVLGIDRLTLVGTSLGGHIAAFAATLIPERVNRIVLVGATGLVPIGREAGEAIRQNVIAVDRDRIAAKLRFVFSDPRFVTEPFVEEEFRINNSPGALQTFQRLGDYMAAGVDNDCVGTQLASLFAAREILLIWGAEDRAVPVAVGEAARSLLGNPDLVLIPHAGHAPYLERPEQFHAALLGFLRTPQTNR